MEGLMGAMNDGLYTLYGLDHPNCYGIFMLLRSYPSLRTQREPCEMYSNRRIFGNGSYGNELHR